MSHPCPVRGCSFMVPDDKLMCPGDWRRLPPATRKAVTDAVRAGGGVLRAAQLAAVQVVNEIRAEL